MTSESMRKGILCFFGELRVYDAVSSFSSPSSATPMASVEVRLQSVGPKPVFQSEGEPRVAIGEGNGVISASEPTLGEERAELGEREAGRCPRAESTDDPLPLSLGSPADDETWYIGISVSAEDGTGIGRESLFRFGLSPRSRCVWIRSPALSGVGG